MLDLESLDLDRLRRLRARFLDAGEAAGGLADYWADGEDLRHYDAVFAARIGWKWDAVLDELAERGVSPPEPETVVDWGCGTGIASRRVAERLGGRRVLLHDRSARARAFAAAALRRAGVREVAELGGHLGPIDLLLVSHVLDELPANALADLLALVERAAFVIWVEPGSRLVARRLATLRDELLGRMAVLAPCTHHDACPALADARDWCHFFARPPAAVFTDAGWVRAGRALGIDLRAVPYSFVALARNAAPPAGGARLVGRPRVGGKIARYHACDETGLHRREVVKSRDRELFRRLDKEPWRCRLL